VFLVILFTSFSGSLVSRISGAVQIAIVISSSGPCQKTVMKIGWPAGKAKANFPTV
ncbi:hypothetical protein ECTW14301_5434, partial [Escherichia coli TW14301]